MPQDLSFCYAALLTSPQAIPSQLAILPEDRQSEIQASMNKLAGMSVADLRMRWLKLRQEEADARLRDCVQRYGPVFSTYSPQLQILLSCAF